jgi:glucosamine kinase
MSTFLAIDAGGTKTDYLLADEHRILARVRGRTIKRMRANAEETTANLDTALAELTLASGLSLAHVTCTCIGAAGESVPMIADWLRSALTQRVAGQLLLLGDVEIALDAAFPDQPGVVAIAGTGSNVAGRDAHGNLTTAGGWGPVLADQGSGVRIGVEALRALFLALDERRPTQMLPAVLAFWDLGSVDHLVQYANTTPAPDFSTLTELVLRCAEMGDPVAAKVLHNEGKQLGHLVSLVLRRLQTATSEQTLSAATWTPQLAFAGSILEHVAPVGHALIAAVRREFPTLRTMDGVVDPIMGALWRARTMQ